VVQKSGSYLFRAGKAAASCILPFTETAGDLESKVKKEAALQPPLY
jgi:hypothetical protein